MQMQPNSINRKKIAIVTGASRGISRSTVESHARHGVQTVFIYHTHGTDAEAVNAAAKEAGAEAIALQLNAGNIAVFDAFSEGVEDVLAKVEAMPLDFLTNNAGNSHPTCRLRRRPRKNSTASTTFTSKASSPSHGSFFLSSTMVAG